jgi:hypothetical protein
MGVCTSKAFVAINREGMHFTVFQRIVLRVCNTVGRHTDQKRKFRAILQQWVVRVGLGGVGLGGVGLGKPVGGI